ncbi:MAG: 5'-nucleotidase C-terminal domain-containing protein [Bacteroidales bacterium]|nr:5'-nucleotidase C-terminal domain-containing protein [Candidatus Cryptobacteroides equifaecalis]
MEMVQTKLIAASLALVVLVSCEPSYKWKRFNMDASRTGVTWTTSENVAESIGTVEDGVYTSPNGRQFKNCCASAVAADMLAVQPRMRDLKLPIGVASEDMVRQAPECALSNLLVDVMMRRTAEETGCKVDLGILNFGGIRTDITRGDVLLDDIYSMLPFKNSYCYVQLKGEDVIRIFEFLARTRPQVIGGARVVVQNRKIKSLEIGGKLVDREALYGVATLDFLLDGGDSLYIARNAKKLIMTDILPKQAIREYVETLTAEGRELEYSADGRYVVLEDE